MLFAALLTLFSVAGGLAGPLNEQERVQTENSEQADQKLSISKMTRDERVTHNNGITYGVCVFYNPEKTLIKYQVFKDDISIYDTLPTNLRDPHKTLDSCRISAFQTKMQRRKNLVKERKELRRRLLRKKWMKKNAGVS